MDTSLIIDVKDPKWMLLGKILTIGASRTVKHEVMFKIVLIAMFFGVCISYVVEEPNNRIEERRFAKEGEIPEAKKIYRFMI
jgi:hypothetical protein